MTSQQFERFMENVNVLANGCWQWTGYVNSSGYGVVSRWREGHTQKLQAHRESFEHFVGAISVGLDIDHLCRNRACVHPLHLEPVTRKINIRRGMRCRDSQHFVPMPEETRQKLASSKIGRKRQPFSEEWRQHLADAGRGRRHSDETRALMSANMKGLKRSPEGRANIAAAARARAERQRQNRVAS